MSIFKRKRKDKPSGMYRASLWEYSCDFCAYQAGLHRCELHKKTVKNMGTMKCADWMDKDAGVAEEDVAK